MKKYYPHSILSFLVLFFTITTAVAQCPLVDAGPDVIFCVGASDIELEVLINGIEQAILPGTETTNYRISIPPCPVPPITGDPTGLTMDDRYFPVQALPFDFEFFDNVYNQFVIGANGKVAFDPALGGVVDNWPIAAGETLPFVDGDSFRLNHIFGVFHDTDPGVGGDINFFVGGVAPERYLVVNFVDVPHFQCNDLRTTEQIIIYESTNIIQVNIVDKPVCAGWNDGLAVLGIQGNDLTEFAVPPGRNTGVWTATNETWYFIPDGLSPATSTFEVIDLNTNTVVATALPLVVAPTVTTTYEVRLTFELPDGTTDIISDQVTVTVTTPPVLPGPTMPLIECDSDNGGFAEFTLTDADDDITGGDPTLIVSYHGTESDAINNFFPLGPLYTNDDIYNDFVWVRVTIVGSDCFTITQLQLEVRNVPLANIPAEPLRVCDDNVPDGFNFFDLTLVEPEVLGAQSPTEFDFHYYESEANAIIAGDLALTAPDYSLEIPTPTMFLNGSTPQTIYILLVGNATSTSPPNPNGSEGCYVIVPLVLIVDPLPEDLGPFEMKLCDDDLNGSTLDDEISTFDLSSQDDLLTAALPNLTVQWYINATDEMADVPIVDPTMFQNTITPQTVVARITTEFDCSITVTMTLTVLANPTPNVAPDAIELCDDDDDGFVTGFDLTLADADIIGGEADVNILYYETLDAAQMGVVGTEIMGLYDNTVANSQIIYARVTRDVPPAELPCYTVVELTLNVIALPDMPDVTFENPLTVCDDDGDGQSLFDLTVQDIAVLSTNTPSTDFEMPIRYYELEADAIADNANFIDPANAFVSGGQTIWVRLESLVTGCARITPFELVVGTFPIAGIGVDLFLCDDEVNGSDATDGLSTFDLDQNTDIINLGDETLSVVYYGSVADQTAGIAVADATAYQNIVSPQQEIFVTITNLEGCPSFNSFFINVEANPAPNMMPDPLIACDDDDDGFFNDFMLTDKDVEIIDGDLDVTIAYYALLVDAEVGGTDDLDSPYTNTSANSQIIFARVTRDTPPGVNPCYTIVELELRVEQLPNEPNLDPEAGVVFLEEYRQCDDDGMEDGIYEFDLQAQDAGVLGVQDATDFVAPINYFETEAAANMGDPLAAIPNADAYPNTANPQTIWVRLENLETGCARVSSFELFVDPLPILNAGPFDQILCDDEINGSLIDDEISTFNLSENNEDIVGTGPIALGYSILYYKDLADFNADLDLNTEIADPTSYQNMDNPQTVYVRVLTEFGCIAETTVTLTVVAVPTPETPTALEVCDGDNDSVLNMDDRDGLSLFDLTEKEIEILDGEANLTVTYYIDFAAADAGVPGTEIVDPTNFENTIVGSQVIYVRVAQDVPPSLLPCYVIVELELVVNPIPDDAAVISNFISCEENTDGDAIFDLTEKSTEILNGQDSTLFDIGYYQSELDANSDPSVNEILNPTAFANVTNPQTIYVRITNNETGCFVASTTDIITMTTSLSFDIIVKEAADATEPAEPYAICDNLDENDGIAEFNLDTDVSNPISAEILNGQDPLEFELTYHETEGNAIAGIDPLPALYVNVINPQVIYARVTNIQDPTDDEPCFEIVAVILKVEQLPLVVFEEEYRLCVDENGIAIPSVEGEVSPPVIDTGLDPALFTFFWSIDGANQPNETGASIAALQSGVYEVLITEIETGCDQTVSTTVIESTPPIGFTVDVTSNAFASNHTIEITIDNPLEWEYSLDDGPFVSTTVFENVEPGDHTITIKDSQGCGSEVIAVGIIDYPRFVTPNQDGFHDRWNIIGIANGDPTAKIYIFDKFGKLLKQLSPQSEGWDGTYNGNPLPSSDYWFRVEYKEDERAKEFTGHFTLKR